jgi:hypothetical protein
MKFNKISIYRTYLYFFYFSNFLYIFFEINNSTSSSTRITSPLKPYYFVLAQSVTVSLFLLSRCISPSLKPKTSSLSPPPPFPATQKWRPVLCSHPSLPTITPSAHFYLWLHGRSPSLPPFASPSFYTQGRCHRPPPRLP